MPVNLSFSTYPFLPLALLVLPLGWQDSMQFTSPNWLLSMHNAFFILMNHQLALMAFFIICLPPIEISLVERKEGKQPLPLMYGLHTDLSYLFPQSLPFMWNIFPLWMCCGEESNLLCQPLAPALFSELLWTGESRQLLISLVTGCQGEECRSGESTGSSAQYSSLL